MWIKIQNINELEAICDEKGFDLKATVEEAEEDMWRNGTKETEIDGIEFTLIKEAICVYDDDGEVICEREPAVYAVRKVR